MSSHCHRYPHCGCGPDIGTKCHLPDGHQVLSEGPEEKKPVDIEALKRDVERDISGRGGGHKVVKSSKGTFQSNRIPPKKKRKNR